MRIPLLTVTIAIAIISVANPDTLAAQNIGTLIGANISTISNAGEGISNVFGAAVNKKKRVGLKGGLYLKIPLAGMFSLEPEVMYAQNGVSFESSSGSIDAIDVDLGYVEVPVLLRVDVFPKSHIHPMLLAGGSGAYRVQCKFGSSSNTSTVAQDCGANGGADDPFKKSDYSAVGGAGLAGNLGGFSASLQLRYSQGLSSIVTNENDLTKPKNRALSVLLGFTF